MNAFAITALALVCTICTAPSAMSQTFTPGQCTGTSRPDVRLDLRDPEVHFQTGVSVAALTAQQRTITAYQNQAINTNGVTRYRVTA